MADRGPMKSGNHETLPHFLATMREKFEKITLGFAKPKEPGTGHIEHGNMGCLIEELLFVAAYLHLLAKKDASGVVIECGAFKGFSSSCLSWACHASGKPFFVADSFRGLPETDEYSCFGAKYRAGDFCGKKSEFTENLRRFGRPEITTVVEGWYADSLKGWAEPVSLLWLDVDLYDSARDVMKHVYSSLSSQGVILSHEVKKFMVKEGRFIYKKKSVPLALHDFFIERGIPYHAFHLTGDLAVIIANPSSHWLLNGGAPAVESIAAMVGMPPRSFRIITREIKEFFYRTLPPLLWLSRALRAGF